MPSLTFTICLPLIHDTFTFIKITAMEDTNKANIVFNISGGNNQILPNATKAEQNFYGDKYIEEMMKAKTKSQEPVLSPETTRLSLYINNVEALAEYVAKLAACTNAKELAQVVMEIGRASCRERV